MSKKRKCNNHYVRFGFTCNRKSEDLKRPQGMLCETVFFNRNLEQSKLQEHFNSRHSGANVVSQAKRVRFDSQPTLPKLGYKNIDKPLLTASYQVDFKIAKSKKPHIIAEELIKRCALEIATIILGNKERKKLELVSLSNNVIQSRIADLSLDILEQVISRMKASYLKISLQFDETTDISNCSQFIALVWYVHDNIIEEDFLFSEELKTTTNEKDIFQLVKNFFAKHKLSIQIIGSVFTDGAPAMLEKNQFFALMEQEIPQLQGTVCFLHRHSLPSKTLSPQLKKVLDISVKTINWIRSRSLNHHFFQSLCEDLRSKHSVLLFHNGMRWDFHFTWKSFNALLQPSRSRGNSL
ncbi:hypothetical protein FHG87_013220 [Trinorchestia longiramus]|nr:hypothetical protein FHG87_013220 [Trinorchestia longiramus]